MKLLSIVLAQVIIISLITATFHVAPMMKHTDRHFRKLFRIVSKNAILYTEMIAADTIIALAEKDRTKLDLLMSFEPDNFTVLQIGSREPSKIKEAVQIAASMNYGYAGYNLNVGCPSTVVASENGMGVAMMKDPSLTAECCNAIYEGLSHEPRPTSAPNLLDVSIKCRIGVDELDSYEFLQEFVETIVSNCKVRTFQVHARKGLSGVGTIGNRMDSLAPLRYEYVYRLVKDFPECKFILNGGITTLEDCVYHMEQGCVDGVMVGRACVNSPFIWSNADEIFANNGDKLNQIFPKRQSRGEIFEKYIEYCSDYEKFRRSICEPLTPKDVATLTAPCFNLFAGEDGSDSFQRVLKKSSKRVTSPARLLTAARACIPQDVLSTSHFEAKSISSLKVYPKAPLRTGRNSRKIV